MTSDIRYHIASLAAVFLALGIGILVGTAFVGTPVVQRQTKLIRRLEDNVGDLRRATAARDNTEKALSTLVPGIISGTLTGRRVLVIQTGAYRDAADAATDTIRRAGAAAVHQVTLPTDNWRREMKSGTSAISDPNTIAEAVGAEARRLAPLLLKAETGGTDSQGTLQSYRERGLVTGDTLQGGPIRLVVLVGGASASDASNGEVDDPALLTFIQQRDLPLIEALTALGTTVVGAEPLEAEVSYLRLYQQFQIATIDAIDRPAGQLALPFCLLGENGSYGLRPGADRVLPPSLADLRTFPARPAASPAAGPVLPLPRAPSPAPS